MRAKPEQFVTLDFEPTGFHVLCDSGRCPHQVQAYYRVIMGSYVRFFCEDCLMLTLLDGVKDERLPSGMVRHAIDPKQDGYMNPGGEF